LWLSTLTSLAFAEERSVESKLDEQNPECEQWRYRSSKVASNCNVQRIKQINCLRGLCINFRKRLALGNSSSSLHRVIMLESVRLLAVSSNPRTNS
jgi:hypothetical protein